MSKNFVENLLSNLETVSKLYREHYGFVYNIIISYFQQKPIEPLLEIEKAFSHLMQSVIDIKDNNSLRAERNLDRFRGHVERMLLDMYKLAFRFFHERAKEIGENCNKHKLMHEIDSLYKKARDFELQHIGATIGDDTKEKILRNYKDLLSEAEKIIQEALIED